MNNITMLRSFQDLKAGRGQAYRGDFVKYYSRTEKGYE